MCLGQPVSDLGFDAWLDFVFAHDDPAWHTRLSADYWTGPPEKTVEYLTSLFESPQVLIDRYAEPRIAAGLDFLVREHMVATLEPSVTWEQVERCLRATVPVFEQLFAKRCRPELSQGRGTEVSPLNATCYMWWDQFPTWGRPQDPAQGTYDRLVLQVLERLLALENEACLESALHGLGHWHLSYPVVAGRIVEGFLAASRPLSAALVDYARAAREGQVS
jgi:hypothetical protein